MEHSKEFVVLTPKYPALNLIEHLWDELDKQVQSMEVPGSIANMLVPDMTAHVQGSSEGVLLTGQGCFGT